MEGRSDGGDTCGAAGTAGGGAASGARGERELL